MCLEHYIAERIFIRLVGSMGGTVKVNEDLQGKVLDFKKKKSGLHIFIDGKEVFHFLLHDYQKGFSLAYERIEQTENGVGRMVMLGCGIDPYDENLPEPRRSLLRTVLDDHLMEIYFRGRINLAFHSWYEKPHFKYWKIDKPGSMAEIILKQQQEYADEDSC